MARKRVYISFDYDNDNDLPGNLIAQADRHDSPFDLVDVSLKEPVDEAWRKEARKRIRRAEIVIVICGEHTHDAVGVAAEVTISREEKRPYYLLKGRRRRTCKKPRTALSSDEIRPWRWATLRELFSGTG